MEYELMVTAIPQQSSRADKIEEPLGSMTRFEVGVELRTWTNRLDRILQARLDEVKTGFNKTMINLETVCKSIDPNTKEFAILDELRGYTESLYRNVFPELIEMYVRVSDNVFHLSSQAIKLRQLNKDLQEQLAEQRYPYWNQIRSFISRLRRRLISMFPNLLRKVLHGQSPYAEQETTTTLDCKEDTAGSVLTPPLPGRFPSEQIDQMIEEVGFTNYESVNNSGTAFEAFDNWTSVVHYDGRRYGSNQPIVTDHMSHIFELHQVVTIKGKRVLELGPFEATNTKQLVDLGAKSIVAIEANTEFYLKCLLVKNELNLDNVEIIYGDCVKVMSDPDFCARPWFDLCFASGILYHMKDPLYFIDLICGTAPQIYIWSQFATDDSPTGPWTELRDGENRTYTARWNSYSEKKHWGGVAEGAFWLTEESMLRAFRDRGFSPVRVKYSQNDIGKAISFVAQREDVTS
jgi:hypothetical protein